MRKRLLWIGGLLCLVALAVAGWVAWDRLTLRPGVTPENFKRLYGGMTEKEAEAILGRPPDTRWRDSGRHWDSWSGEEIEITLAVTEYAGPGESWVSFGEMTRSDGSVQTYRGEPPPSLLVRLRERFMQ
jgi:hypothetical protein